MAQVNSGSIIMNENLTPRQKGIALNLKAIFERKKRELGLTQESAAKAMGWKTQGAVSNYLNGKIPLNTDAKLKFAKLLGVKVADFDPEFKHEIQIESANSSNSLGSIDVATTKSSTELKTSINEDYFLVPQYNDIRLSAGHGTYLSEIEGADDRMAFKRKWLSAKNLDKTKLVVVYADGDSMHPTINDGDVLLVNTADTAIISGRIYALKFNGVAIVKRLILKMDQYGSVIIRSDNTDKDTYPDAQVNLSSDDIMIIIGRCVWHGGDL